MTEINYAAIKRVVEQIKAHRKAFNMTWWSEYNWARTRDYIETLGDGTSVVLQLENIDTVGTQCGTTLCIAGFAMLDAGWKVKYASKRDEYGSWVESQWYSPHGGRYAPDWVVDAAKYFGLPVQPASRLFHYINDNDEALEALEDIANGVPFEEIYILQDESDHCRECSTCQFESHWSEDEDCEDEDCEDEDEDY